MKLGFIGAGNVGGALGNAWAGLGHDVYFGVKDPSSDSAKALVTVGGPRVRAVTIPEAVAECGVLFLVLPWSAVKDVLASLGDLTGKILIDCTNPIAPGMVLAIGHTTSGGEEVAKLAPGARVVKGFHTTGAENMASARFGESVAANFLCSDDNEAKQVAMGLSAELGWEPVDAGPLSQARLTEPLAMLWISLAYKQGLGRDFAFSLLRRQPVAVGAGR